MDFLGNDLFAEGISRQGHCQKATRGLPREVGLF